MLDFFIQKYQQLTSTSIQNEVQKVFQNPRQNGPKCTHVGSKNEAPMGYPIDFWGSFSRFLRFLAVLGCQVRLGRCFGPLLGRSWSRLGAVLWPYIAHLGGALGAQDGPKLLPRRPKMPLRCLQDGLRWPKRPPRCPKMPPRGPKRPPKGLQELPRSIFPPNLDPLNLSLIHI